MADEHRRVRVQPTHPSWSGSCSLQTHSRRWPRRCGSRHASAPPWASHRPPGDRGSEGHQSEHTWLGAQQGDVRRHSHRPTHRDGQISRIFAGSWIARDRRHSRTLCTGDGPDPNFGRSGPATLHQRWRHRLATGPTGSHGRHWVRPSLWECPSGRDLLSVRKHQFPYRTGTSAHLRAVSLYHARRAQARPGVSSALVDEVTHALMNALMSTRLSSRRGGRGRHVADAGW